MKRRTTDGRMYFRETYVPFDELLRMPRIRVLRTMRRFDWFSSIDVIDALHLPENEIRNYNTVLSRLVRDGHLDREGSRITYYRYRVNASGRANLREWMARAELPESGSLAVAS